MQFKWIIIIINIIMISLLLLFFEVLYSKIICHGPAINVVKRRCSQFQTQTRFILNLTLKMLSPLWLCFKLQSFLLFIYTSVVRKEKISVLLISWQFKERSGINTLIYRPFKLDKGLLFCL